MKKLVMLLLLIPFTGKAQLTKGDLFWGVHWASVLSLKWAFQKTVLIRLWSSPQVGYLITCTITAAKA